VESAFLTVPGHIFVAFALAMAPEEVLVIDRGRIIERGDHESLLARRGFYHRLYMSQFKGQADP
jgi:ABC-type bacteriocin/lantibiotic exporter with double-glycine peptidase domain